MREICFSGFFHLAALRETWFINAPTDYLSKLDCSSLTNRCIVLCPTVEVAQKTRSQVSLIPTLVRTQASRRGFSTSKTVPPIQRGPSLSGLADGGAQDHKKESRGLWERAFSSFSFFLHRNITLSRILLLQVHSWVAQGYEMTLWISWDIYPEVC